MRYSFSAYLRILSTFAITSVCLAQTPVINANGVTNGGSFLPGIASGSWITIKGTNLSTTTRSWAQADFKGTALPLSLDGVSVKVNNKDAPIYFISPTQVNALAPSDTATGSVGVTVTTSRGTSAVVTATLQRAAPAWFAFSQQGGVYPAAVHLSGTYVGPTTLFGSAAVSTPAQPNERILLFGTGFGATNPAVDPLTIFSGAAPLATPSDLRITVGGQTATVEFAGLVTNGEYQFNIIVPNLLDGEYGLIATIGGVQTQTLRIVVQSPPKIPPSITSVTPSSGQAGQTIDTVTINGQNLAGVTSVGFSPSTGLSVSIVNVTDTAVTARLDIASSAAIGQRSLTVMNGTLNSNSLPFTITAAPPPLPVITSISPTSAEVSQFVIGFAAFGQNLGFQPKVSFNPAQGITVIAYTASGSSILQIANDAVPGPRQVTVTTGAGVSNAVTFTIMPKTGNFNISNLRAITPTGTAGSFSLTVDFTDPSGSAARGVNYVVDTSLGVDFVSAIPQGVVSGSTSGTIRLDFMVGPGVSRLGQVQVNLVNPAGNRSNTLSGVF